MQFSCMCIRMYDKYIILDLNQLIFLCILVKPTLRNILSVTKVLCIGMHCHFSLKNALHLSLSNGY